MDGLKNTEGPSFKYETERIELQDTIKKARLMLWANDIETAHQLLMMVHDRYSQLYSDALRLKTKMTKVFRADITTTKNQLRKEKIVGRELDGRMAELRVEKIRLENTDEDNMYLIMPLIATLDSLKIKLDLSPGSPKIKSFDFFRVSATQVGIKKWEYRGYHLQDKPTILEKFLEVLQKELGLRFVSERQEEIIDWPIWMHAFNPDSFVELRFFSSNQFEVTINAEHHSIADDFIRHLVHTYNSAVHQ